MAKLEFRPCKYEHLKLITPNAFSRSDLGLFLSPEYKYIIDDSAGVSAWRGIHCVAAFGLLPVYPGRKSMAWALVSRDIGPELLELTRALKRHLDVCSEPRVEMLVLSEFKAGHKWAKMLGFTCETPDGMRKHSPLGEDEHLYARVKG